MTMTSLCCFFLFSLFLTLSSFSLASSPLFKILPQETSLKILSPFEIVKLTHTHTTFSSERQNLWACFCNHEVAMSAKALCSPQEAIRSQQFPFQQVQWNCCFRSLSDRPTTRNPHWQQHRNGLFYNHQTINCSQSGQILFYLSFLFIELAAIAH